MCPRMESHEEGRHCKGTAECVLGQEGAWEKHGIVVLMKPSIKL